MRCYLLVTRNIGVVTRLLKTKPGPDPKAQSKARFSKPVAPKAGVKMLNISFPVIAAWVDAGVLSLAGLVNLIGLRPVRDIYADWDIPERFYHTLGLLQILAAVFLTSPDMRFYGILLAAPILFGSVVMLLNHEHYAV